MAQSSLGTAEPFRLFGEHVGKVVQLVTKSELERTRLIREARALYDMVFPPAAPDNKQREPDQALLSETSITSDPA